MIDTKSLSKEIEDIFFSYDEEQIIVELYDLFKGIEDAFLKSTLLSILDDAESDEEVNYELLSTMLQSELESVADMSEVSENIRLSYGG